MASSGNFPLWSPLIKGATNLNSGNTRFTGATNSKSAATTFAPPPGTKFYIECPVVQATNYNIVFGLVGVDQAIDTYLESQGTVNGMIFHGYSGSEWRTQALVNGSRQGFSGNVGMSTNRVLGMTINRVDNEIKMYLDNSLIGNGTISISATQEYRIFASFTGGTASGVHMNINCGHDSTGAGDFSAGGNADENGFGDFQYSPPSGFLAPCSANLPISDDIDPAQTDDDYIGGKQFEAIKYTGNDGSPSNNITYGFQPDMVMHKMLGSTGGGYPAQLWDSTRGDDYYMYPFNTSGSVSDGSDYLEFTSTGVKLDNNWDGLNHSGESYISYGWRANGGTTVTNTEGSINNTLQANQNNGFSISQFSNSSGAQTIGHGLGKAPAFYIIKIASSGGSSWGVYHKGLGATKYLRFNSLNGATTASNYFNDTEPTSTVLSVGSTWTATSIMCYAWAEIEGFSKFGIYDGSGSTDGTFIYTGFRPKMVWIKRTNAASVTYGWPVFIDEVTDNINKSEFKNFWLDQSVASGNFYGLDFLSNGFKHRNSNTNLDASGSTYIYCAWGDVPFKYNNTF